MTFIALRRSALLVISACLVALAAPATIFGQHHGGGGGGGHGGGGHVGGSGGFGGGGGFGGQPQHSGGFAQHAQNQGGMFPQAQHQGGFMQHPQGGMFPQREQQHPGGFLQQPQYGFIPPQQHPGGFVQEQQPGNYPQLQHPGGMIQQPNFVQQQPHVQVLPQFPQQNQIVHQPVAGTIHPQWSTSQPLLNHVPNHIPNAVQLGTHSAIGPAVATNHISPNFTGNAGTLHPNGQPLANHGLSTNVLPGSHGGPMTIPRHNHVPANGALAGNMTPRPNSGGHAANLTANHLVMKPSVNSTMAANRVIAGHARNAGALVANGVHGNGNLVKANRPNGPSNGAVITKNGPANNMATKGVSPANNQTVMAGNSGKKAGGQSATTIGGKGNKGNTNPSLATTGGKGKNPGTGKNNTSVNVNVGVVADGAILDPLIGGGVFDPSGALLGMGADSFGGDGLLMGGASGIGVGPTVVSTGDGLVSPEAGDDGTGSSIVSAGDTGAVNAGTADSPGNSEQVADGGSSVDPSAAGALVVAANAGTDPGVVPTSATVAIPPTPQPPDDSAANSPEALAAGRLILINPKDSGGSVNYTLDASPFTIDPGSVQDVSAQGPWVVAFDRGVEGAQEARYTLTGGKYTFTLTEKGWELYNTTVTQTAQADAAGATVSSSAGGQSAQADANGTPDTSSAVTDGQDRHRLLVLNPKDSGGTVNYRLEGKDYTIEPGSTQDLNGAGSWLAEFDRGVDGAQGRYKLTDGTYTFTLTDKGWELYNATYAITLDNTANDGPFYFLRDGREESVTAKGTQKVTSKFPIVVTFDRGDGGQPAQRTLDKNGSTYRIGLAENSTALDLLPDTGQ